MFDTMSFNVYAHLGLGYGTLGLGNEKGVEAWRWQSVVPE